MNSKLREKANSFDRILRQRATNYLKNVEKHTSRLMEITYDKGAFTFLKRIERLKNGISQIKYDIEYGSFLSLPAFRSERRFSTETPTKADEEIPRLLFIDELMLLECRNLFDKLQEIERKAYTYTPDDAHFLELFEKTEESLRRIERLQLSRSSLEGVPLDSIIANYEEKVNELQELAERENLFLLEINSGVVPKNKGSIFTRFISAISRKPTFEREISDVILLVGEKIKMKTGGLVKLPVLYSIIKAVKPSLRISIKDVENAVRTLEKKGLIPGLREISGIKIVELLPVTATPDQNTMLGIAAGGGQLTIEEVLLKTKWTYERAIRALKQMEELGICRYDVVSRKWIFPVFTEDYKLERIGDKI